MKYLEYTEEAKSIGVDAAFWSVSGMQVRIVDEESFWDFKILGYASKEKFIEGKNNICSKIVSIPADKGMTSSVFNSISRDPQFDGSTVKEI